VEISHDRIRGPVDWPATQRRRLLTREPHHVTRPRRRDVDVQPSRALALLLTEIRDLAQTFSGWRGDLRDGGIAARISEVGARAAALAAHRALRDVTPAPLTPRELVALQGPRLRQRFSAAVAAHLAHQRLVSQVDKGAIRDSVERFGLVASSDGTLFEIAVLFTLRTHLQEQGFVLDPLRLFRGSLRFVGVRDRERVTGIYQSTPRAWREGSRYRAAQAAHGLPAVHDLRPDVVLRVESPGTAPRWLAIEAKTTSGTVSVPHLARRAIVDLLAYRAAFASVLAEQQAWGLGVVWGEGLEAADHPVGVCTRDGLGEALGRFLSDAGVRATAS
jgi:hypothetical protein